ncbi:hypothetical protein Pan5_15 [Pseudanabaena phage Pan5]|nr:hypothetical protein Pan5_15 [Pseudanabaena phage Pan5]
MFTLFKDWLYFLQDKDGRSYRVNNGNVEPTGTPTFLQEGPDGWQEKSIRWGRSTKYFGMVRSYTTPLKFVKSGARIIRDILFRTGFEARLFLVIHKLDKSFNGGLIHKLFYKGEIDLAKTISSPDTVTVNIMEGGLDALIKANEAATYEIPMDSPGSVIVEHDGILLQTKGNFSMVTDLLIDNSQINNNWLGAVINLRNDGQAFGVEYLNQSLEGAPNIFDIIAESDNWFARNSNPYTISLQVKGKLRVKTVENSVNGSYRLRFLTSTQNTGNQNLYDIIPGVANAVEGETEEFEFDITIPLEPEETLFFWGTFVTTTGGIGISIEFKERSEFSIFTVSRYRTERYAAFTPVALGQLLLDKIAGPGYTFVSNYLSTEWNGLLVTSGDALRGFENAKLKTSWNDFWKSYNAVCNLEMRIVGDEVRVEKKENAFGATVVANLGAVKVEDEKGFKVAEEYCFNTIKVGYPNSQIQDANGRYEVNVGQLYTTNITRIIRELDLTSAYSASIYDIEYTRINFEGKETTNGETDANVYFIHCDNTPVLDDSALFFKYLIRRDPYDQINGIFDPATVYNIEISPKRNLLRHGNWIRSGLYFEQNSEIVFQSSDKNAELETVVDATIISPEFRIKESGNVRVSRLDSPLFIPIEFTGESPAPANIYQIMENTPTERFSFLYRGITYYGYPLEVQVQPADNAPQDTRLLLSPNNNLLNLIHG